MKEWKYSLEGSVLRSLIKDGDKQAEVIERLEYLYKRLLKKLDKDDKEYYQYEIEDNMSVLEGEADIIRNKPHEILEWGFDNVNELTNERLKQFYDICDNCRCWVDI